MSVRIVRGEVCGGWVEEQTPGWEHGTPVVIVDAATWERVVGLLKRYTRSVHHDALDAETEALLAETDEEAK